MLELMPDGTFKKLSKLQTDALERYYKREKDNELWVSVIQSPLFPTLVYGTLGIATLVVGWAYLKDKELPSGDDAGRWVAGGLSTIYSKDPQSPKTITLADGTTRELTRCQRWEQDAQSLDIAGEEGGVLHTLKKFPLFAPNITILQATKAVSIIRNMKREGCGRSLVFTPEQWKEAQL